MYYFKKGFLKIRINKYVTTLVKVFKKLKLIFFLLYNIILIIY